MWWSSTGEMVMAPSFSVEAVEELVDDSHEHEEREDGHDGREVDRTERRQDPPEESKVRLADVTEEVGDPPDPDRVRQTHPRRQHVREDQQDVDVDENVDE